LLLALQIGLPPLPFLTFIVLLAHIALYFANALRLFWRNMKIRWLRFNLYLCVALPLAAVLAAGCQTEARKRKHQPSKLSVHLETHADASNPSERVPIYRQHPFMVNVQKEPILTELNITEAQVEDVVGGFAIRLQFDQQGTWILEQHSVDSRGLRFAIYCEFGKQLKEKRWLAAPIISRRISDGVFVFTPDATREEADQLVLGLTNIGREVKKKNEW
jgi:preprotein translocase subunit SecD